MKPYNVWVLMLLLFITSCSDTISNDNKIEYPVIQPKQISTSFKKQYLADIVAFEHIELRSRIDGVIEKVLVDEGEIVKQGQLLFQIDSRSYEQDLRRAQSILASKIAELNSVKIELENTRRLYSKEIVSKSEFDLIESKQSVANAIVEEARGNVRQCELNLSYTKIIAPFTGKVNRLLLKRGSIVNQDALITTLTNDHEIFAYFNLNESQYLNYFKSTSTDIQNKVELQLSDGTLFTNSGKIETSETIVDKTTGNIALRAKFNNKEGLLKHGSSATIIWAKPAQNAVIIPKKSTFEVQDYIYVFVVDKDGLAKQRSIKILEDLPLYYAIESGLNLKEKILYDGIQMVKNNEKIQFKLIPFPELK
jgi:membrane fusion protein (multidrug efflux system)